MVSQQRGSVCYKINKYYLSIDKSWKNVDF